MRILLKTQYLLAATVAIALAGCSGVAMPSVYQRSIEPSPTQFQSARHTWMASVGPDTCNVIYLSDSFDGTIRVLRSTSPFRQIGSLNGYGWGVAATPTTIYAGTSSDRIDEYAPCGSTVQRSLTGGGHGPPSGIAIDGVGTVYATELGDRRIDIFKHGTTHTTAIDPNMPTPYFIATDKYDNVYLQGPGPSPQHVDFVDKCGRDITGCRRFATITKSVGAGGVVVDKHYQDVIANDTNGVIYVFNQAGTLRSSFSYGTPGSVYWFEGIALGENESAVWGANNGYCNSSQLCGDAVRLKFDLATGTVLGISAMTPPIQGGGPSRPVTNGIALYPVGPR